MDDRQPVGGDVAPATLERAPTAKVSLPVGQLAGRRSLVPAGATHLVKVDGALGVFTPLTGDESGEVGEKNLEEIIDLLRDRVAELESRNLELERALEERTAALRRSSDDFATAVSHTVDSLQSRLHEARNPVSRFAVRSFDIEATVHVDVTPLGTIDYRFLRPEDTVDPARLSTIKVSIAPIGREDTNGAGHVPAFSRQLDVEEIQGIGEVYQKKLVDHDIYTVDDLLMAGARVRNQVELAAMLGVERNRLAEWLSHAGLMVVKGIGGREAEVLHEIGITTLAQLAEADAAALTAAYDAKVDELGRRSLTLVDEDTVEGWIQAAAAQAGARAG